MEPTNKPDYQHGYSSGVGGVDRDNYEGYLSSQISTDWLTERLDEKRAERATTERQLAEATDAHRTAYADLQTYALQVERLNKQVSQREADRQVVLTARDALQERRTKAAPDYSLLAGLLFLVAGISFLAGDLIISHEIVAYALNIRNSDEAWAFAVGLAMVSILLKPAYDRLIEQPYQENPAQNRGRYERFKMALAVFAVLTLAVLGWFRYEAYRTDQLKAAINKSVRQLQLSSDPLASTSTLTPSVMTQIEKQLAESSELNLALVNSPWALLSFVLSGILFALAGAVCLGIALPVLSAFWFRWLQADIRLGKYRRRLRRMDNAMVPLESQLAEQRTHQNVLQHNLDLLPNLADLKARLQTQTADVNQLLAELKLAQTDSRIGNFNDGYGQGAIVRDTLTDDEQRQFQRERLLATTNRPPRPAESATGSAADKPVNGKATAQRPYQTVRQFLSDQL